MADGPNPHNPASSASPPGLDPSDEPIRPSSRVGQFRHNTVSGAILTGVALGLREVLDPKVDDEPPIILDWSGDPPAPRPIDVELDPDDPAASSAIVRPHLLDPPDPTEP